MSPYGVTRPLSVNICNFSPNYLYFPNAKNVHETPKSLYELDQQISVRECGGVGSDIYIYVYMKKGL